MKLEKIVFIFIYMILIQFIFVECDCAIEKDPNVLTTCLQIDFTSIILGLNRIICFVKSAKKLNIFFKKTF